MSVGAAGKELGGFLSVIPACDFVRCFGPCGDDHVVVMLVFILLLTFRFFIVLLFALLFHRVVPHPELVDMRTVPAPNYALLCYLRCRMSFGTLRSVPVGTAGKRLWWIPFRDSVGDSNIVINLSADFVFFVMFFKHVDDVP